MKQRSAIAIAYPARPKELDRTVAENVSEVSTMTADGCGSENRLNYRLGPIVEAYSIMETNLLVCIKRRSED